MTLMTDNIVPDKADEPRDDDGLPLTRLTRREIKELREMLEADRRARWAWSTGRIWATWLAGSMVAVYSLYDTVEKLIKKITG